VPDVRMEIEKPGRESGGDLGLVEGGLGWLSPAGVLVRPGSARHGGGFHDGMLIRTTRAVKNGARAGEAQAR